MAERGKKTLVREKPQTITVRIRRGDRQKSYLVDYEVPFEKGLSVLGVLQFIYDHLDSGIGFSSSCRIGLCASCLVRVNGKVLRACTTMAEDQMLIEPYKDAAVIRDLISELPHLASEANRVLDIQGNTQNEER
jgi:succinate dehydrogenase / fumarate reductase iron-sulfur subunit